MAGGVLIFVIFVVDLVVTKFPPTKISAYGTGYESVMMGVAINIMPAKLL